jgi:predicted O-methyltransferase YrrM
MFRRWRRLCEARPQPPGPAAPLPRIYSAPDAAATLHLYELLESVHFAGLPVIDLSVVVRLLSRSRPTPLQAVAMHPRLTSLGSGSVAEMAALATLTAARAPRQVLEFGTYDGCSTWHLWANSPPQARLTTIDLPAGASVSGSTDVGLQGVAARPFLPPVDGRVTLVETDSRAWQPDVPAAVELCFIDAGHSEECVRNDTEKALRLMAPDGVVVWHDASWTRDGYAVNAYLKELLERGYKVRLVRVGPYDYCALAVLLLGVDPDALSSPLAA